MNFHFSTGSLLVLLDHVGLEAVEVGNAQDGGSVGVELLLRVLVVVALALKTDADAAGDILHTELPDLLVKLGVQAHIVSAHGLLCELDYLLHTPGRTLLESEAVDTLVQVDSVFALVSTKGQRTVTTSSGGLAFVRTESRARLPLRLVRGSHGVRVKNDHLSASRCTHAHIHVLLYRSRAIFNQGSWSRCRYRQSCRPRAA